MSLGVPPDWPAPIGPYEGQDKPLKCRDPICSIKVPHDLTDDCDQMREEEAMNYAGCNPQVIGDEKDRLAMRLRRVERDMKNLEHDIREESSGSQDGYLLEIANRIRNIMA